MGKLNKFVKGLQIAQTSLNVLDQFVDVDRLIGISNAQGPQAKLIRAILEIDPEDFADNKDAADFLEDVTNQMVQLPRRQLSSKQKKKPKKSPSKGSS